MGSLTKENDLNYKDCSLFNTPILFLIFNRPDSVQRVFETIRAARPSRLYIAADGPRDDSDDDPQKIKDARFIATQVVWPCEVKTLFRDRNLGCKEAVSSAITWFFEHEEQGIILEDDCLPHPDFFSFCESLLEYYQENERVMVITGNNFQNGRRHGDASYYFSKYNHCWGWATWRRAWKYYEGDIPFWPSWKTTRNWRQVCPRLTERMYWQRVLNCVCNNEIDTWDYPWTASVWYNGGLTATPNVNLVSNIGFGESATHTKSKSGTNASLPSMSIGDLKHPETVSHNLDADRYVFDHHFGGKRMRFPHLLLYGPARIVIKIVKSALTIF